MERNSVSVPPPPPASKTATPPEPGCSLKGDLEVEVESLLHRQTAASLRKDAQWDEQSTDRGGAEEELEMTEGADNVEFCGNSDLYYAMTGNLGVVPLIDK